MRYSTGLMAAAALLIGAAAPLKPAGAQGSDGGDKLRPYMDPGQEQKADDTGKSADKQESKNGIIGTVIRTDGGDGVVSTLPISAFAGQGDGLNWVFSGGAGADIKVSPDISNTPIREAVKRIIGKADVTYDFDQDVPDDIRVSLKANNISLTTAINAVVESAGIGCVASAKQTVSDANGRRTVVGHTHYHFVKRPTGAIVRGGSPLIFDRKNGFQPFAGGDAAINLDGKLKALQGLKVLNGEDFAKAGQDYANAITKSLGHITADGTPSIYNVFSSEERTTFTCPHCKQQVTIVRKRTSPKCPTCGRTIEGDWKFCPFDGTKRPDDPSDWKFCPHCGKPVTEKDISGGK